MALVVCGAAVAQLALVRAGWPGWPCPAVHAFGVPCPGCGLTRATVALLGGDWRTALALHAFAPALLGAFALVASAAVLPERPRRLIISGVETLERRVHMSRILFAGLLLYWSLRLLFSHGTLIRLMRG